VGTIKDADVIHVMRDGAIVESGAHDALMDKKGEYYQLYLGQEKEE
jgi:ATP-binding cassette subfamily B protein